MRIYTLQQYFTECYNFNSKTIRNYTQQKLESSSNTKEEKYGIWTFYLFRFPVLFEFLSISIILLGLRFKILPIYDLQN